jgi:nitrile hydratase
MGGTGAWNIDMSRHAREKIPPAEYLASPYYGIWLKGLERLLLEKGLATEAELRSGRADTAGASLPRKPTAKPSRRCLLKAAQRIGRQGGLLGSLPATGCGRKI